jgi:predicted nucleic acid-binding protein
MLQDLKMTPGINNWKANTCLVRKISDKFDDVLIGNTCDDRILDFPEDDILINYHGKARCDRQYPLVEQVGNDTLREKFAHWSIYDSAGLDTFCESANSDIIYGNSRDTALVGGTESDRTFDSDFNASLEGNTDSNIPYGDLKPITWVAGKEGDRIFNPFPNESLEGNINDEFFYGGNDNNMPSVGDASDYLQTSKPASLLAKTDNERLFEEAGSDMVFGKTGNDPIGSHPDLDCNDEANNYQFDLITNDSDPERAIEKKVLLDADIILDVLLDRYCPTLEDSVAALDLVSSKLVKGYIASSDLEQIVWLAQLRHNSENANRIKQKLLNFLEVCEVDGKLLREASQMPLPNFKNTIQLACAVRYNLDAIVTLNSQDFWGDENLHPEIDVFTPGEFLNNYYGLDLCDAINDTYVEFREKLEKDLEANCMLNEEILDEKLSLGTGWVVDNWIVRSAQNNFTEATVILRNPETGKQHPEFAIANGPIEASCKALDKLVKQLYKTPEYSFKDFFTKNVSDEGAAATVEATVMVKCGDLTYTSDYTHRSITQAVFYAYVKSVDQILRSETPKKTDRAVSKFSIDGSRPRD